MPLSRRLLTTALVAGLLLAALALSPAVAASTNANTDDDQESQPVYAMGEDGRLDLAYFTKYKGYCVGAGAIYKQALPCPSNCLSHCVYTLNMTVDSWSDFLEGRPHAQFLVFPSGDQFSLWNDNQPFQVVTEGLTQMNWTVTFYVPPGSSYLFVAYNKNWLFSMYMTGFVEFFPNTLPGDSTNVPGSVAQNSLGSQYKKLHQDAMFALGLAMGLDDNGPYSPPSQACLAGAEGMVAMAETVMADLDAVVSSPHPVGAVLQLLADIEPLLSNHSAVFAACRSSCPGFAQKMLLKIMELAVRALPNPIIKGAFKAVEIIYDGVNIVEDITAMIDAQNPGRHYKMGYAMGNLARHAKHAYKVVSRRDASAMPTLRYNDGVVRSLAEWRALYPHDEL